MRHLALLSVGRNPFFVFSTTRMKTFAVVYLDASNADQVAYGPLGMSIPDHGRAFRAAAGGRG
jgi:hypothetical protein